MGPSTISVQIKDQDGNLSFPARFIFIPRIGELSVSGLKNGNLAAVRIDE